MSLAPTRLAVAKNFSREPPNAISALREFDWVVDISVVQTGFQKTHRLKINRKSGIANYFAKNSHLRSVLNKDNDYDGNDKISVMLVDFFPLRNEKDVSKNSLQTATIG